MRSNTQIIGVSNKESREKRSRESPSLIIRLINSCRTEVKI